MNRFCKLKLNDDGSYLKHLFKKILKEKDIKFDNTKEVFYSFLNDIVKRYPEELSQFDEDDSPFIEKFKEEVSKATQESILEVHKRESIDYKTEYQYCIADIQNLNKKHIQDISIAQDKSKEKTIKPLLESIDQLDMVINSSKDQSDPVIQGMKMILSNFQKELDKMGVTVYHDHEIFNPHFHEAIQSVDGDEDNKIVNVYKKAYLINENLLRPAQVVVSKKKEE